MGYFPPNLSNLDRTDYDALLFCKTNIGGYFFDAFMSVEHERTLTVTSNPVETGADIVDHAYMNPAKVVMNVMVSDVHESLIPGQFSSEGRFRHTSAWKVLKTIQENRIPVSVFTKLGRYENMLIEKLTATDTYKTYRALNAEVSLVEIPVARVRKVKISSASQTTVETEMGKVEVFGNQSILKYFRDSFMSFFSASNAATPTQ